MKLKITFPGVPAVSRAIQRWSPMRRFALPVLALTIAASWLVTWEARGRVAPTGVATTAGLRHADASAGALPQ